MTPYITESEVEELALGYFALLGYEVRYGPDIADDGVTPERESYIEVIRPGQFLDWEDALPETIAAHFLRGAGGGGKT